MLCTTSAQTPRGHVRKKKSIWHVVTLSKLRQTRDNGRGRPFQPQGKHMDHAKADKHKKLRPLTHLKYTHTTDAGTHIKRMQNTLHVPKFSRSRSFMTLFS